MPATRKGKGKSTQSTRKTATGNRSPRVITDHKTGETVVVDEPIFDPETGRVRCPFLWCDSTVSRPHDLKRHLMSHTGERPFKCHLCPGDFPQRSALKHHINMHTGEKPFRCGLDGCTAKFSDPSSCNRHIREKHDRIRFVCPMSNCDREEKRRANFLKHVSTKHGLNAKIIEPNDYKRCYVPEEPAVSSEEGTVYTQSQTPSFVISSEPDQPAEPRYESSPGPVRTRRRAPERNNKPYARTRQTRSTALALDNSCIDPQLLTPGERWQYSTADLDINRLTSISPMPSESYSRSSYSSVSPAPPDEPVAGPSYLHPSYHYQQQQQQQQHLRLPPLQIPQQAVGMISNHSRNPYGRFNMHAATSGNNMYDVSYQGAW